MQKIICKNCNRKFIPYDKTYNILCYKCKKKILKKLIKPIDFNNFFIVQTLQGIKTDEEYSVSPELKWINNVRYSTDYWMYNNMA